MRYLPECLERADSFVRMGGFNIYGKLADLLSLYSHDCEDLLS